MNRSVSARKHVYRLTLDAMFVALYVILGTFLSFKLPGAIQISFSTLPILLCAFLLHPLDAVAVAVGGNFLEQVLDPSPYGFATLLLWLIPGAVQALIAGFGSLQIEKKIKAEQKSTALLATVLVLVCAEIALTTLNTVTLYLDGALLGYSVKALHLLLPMRLLNLAVRTVLSCILVPLLLPPLRRVLAKIYR